MEISSSAPDSPDYDVIQKKRGFCKGSWSTILYKVLLVVMFITLFILLVFVLTLKHTTSCEVDCFYPIGGGSALTADYRGFIQTGVCDAAFNKYTKDQGSQYWKDTERAIASASKALIEDAPSKVEYSQMVVFDIDETVISNLEEIKNVGFGVFEEDKWNEWVYAAHAPAIPKSLELYKELRGKGYSVLFLTGRHEHFREATSKNLNASGFGTQCTSSEPAPARGDLCYHDLVLRVKGDTQDALLYKSAARGKYVEEGFEMVGGLGDQWSDLMGNNQPSAIFKLPNPFYFIP